MNNLNIEKFQEIAKKGKKFAIQKVASAVLATGLVVGMATPIANAANVHFTDVRITYDYSIQGNEYTSGNLTDQQYNSITSLMKNIDESFNNLYTVMANGGMTFGTTMTKNQSMARLLASLNEIENTYAVSINALDSTCKSIANAYMQSKSNEVKSVYSSLMLVSLQEIDNYSKQYNCVFANSIGSQANTTTVAVYNKQQTLEEINTYQNVTDNYRMIIVPALNKKPSNGRMVFKTKYNGMVVSKANYASAQAIIQEAGILFDKIENALEQGNYTKNVRDNFTMEDVYISLYGDMNLVVNSINAKYSSNKEALEVAKLYMLYRQDNIVANAYQKNSEVNYEEFASFSSNYTSVRKSEENGYVYYDLTAGGVSSIHSMPDKGYLRTSELKIFETDQVQNSSTGLKQVQYQVSTGINIYHDDQAFFPTDINGNSVKPFVYDGTTYLPVRALCNLFHKNVVWDNGTKSVFLSDKEAHISSVPTGIPYIEYEGKIYIQDANGQFTVPYGAIDEEVNYGTGTISKSLKSEVLNGYEGIKIYYNNQPFTPTDVNGKVVPVISWNNTTYLPVRAISNLFGVEVAYDSTTNGVYLGKHAAITNPSVSAPQTPVASSDIYFEVYDKNGNMVNLYIEEGTEYYYVIENGSKRYFSEADTYYLDAARTQLILGDGHTKGKTR